LDVEFVSAVQVLGAAYSWRIPNRFKNGQMEVMNF